MINCSQISIKWKNIFIDNVVHIIQYINLAFIQVKYNENFHLENMIIITQSLYY